MGQFLGTLSRSFAHHPFDMARRTLWTFGLRPLASLALHHIAPKAHKASRLARVLGSDPFWASPERELRAEQRRRADAALTSPLPAQGFYLREMRSALDHPLVSMKSEEQYQLGKRIGIRFLHPFSDPDLVEMLYRIPPRLLNQGGRTKGLVRGTVARRFPGLGFEGQRKVEATSFYRSLILHEGPALANAAIDFPALSGLGIVDGKAASAAVREGLNQHSKAFFRFFHILNLEMWTRAYA